MEASHTMLVNPVRFLGKTLFQRLDMAITRRWRPLTCLILPALSMKIVACDLPNNPALGIPSCWFIVIKSILHSHESISETGTI